MYWRGAHQKPAEIASLRGRDHTTRFAAVRKIGGESRRSPNDQQCPAGTNLKLGGAHPVFARRIQ